MESWKLYEFWEIYSYTGILDARSINSFNTGLHNVRLCDYVMQCSWLWVKCVHGDWPQRERGKAIQIHAWCTSPALRYTLLHIKRAEHSWKLVWNSYYLYPWYIRKTLPHSFIIRAQHRNHTCITRCVSNVHIIDCNAANGTMVYMAQAL